MQVLGSFTMFTVEWPPVAYSAIVSASSYSWFPWTWLVMAEKQVSWLCAALRWTAFARIITTGVGQIDLQVRSVANAWSHVLMARHVIRKGIDLVYTRTPVHCRRDAATCDNSLGSRIQAPRIFRTQAMAHVVGQVLVTLRLVDLLLSSLYTWNDHENSKYNASFFS